MSAALDLPAYFHRIGLTEQPQADLATLRRIHALHPGSIAFENLSVLLGQPVLLDLGSLQKKMITQGRGGYCFEHNTLLWQVLRAVDFKVSALAARVRWNVPREQTTAMGHMLLRVECETESYIADVGFGGLTLTAPLRLYPDIEQQTPHELFRLTESAGDYTLEARIDVAWKPLYCFNLRQQYAPDFEAWNWYASTAPQSVFMRNLMVARPEATRRHALFNNRYTVHELGGHTTTRLLTGAAEMRAVLTEAFRIRLPEGDLLTTKLQQIAEQPG